VHRRHFIKKLFSLAAAAITGCFPWRLATAAWPETHFGKGELNQLFRALFGEQTLIESDDIHVSLPETAENGAVVPITISSELEQISRIYIWVEKNPTPLAAEFELDASMAVYLTARIKMAESCHVVVVAEQGQHLLRKQQWVKVMQGGCGTG